MKTPRTRRMDPLIGKLKLLNEAETGPFISTLRQRKSPTILGFLNQHGYNIAQRHASVRDSFMHVDHLLRDGIEIGRASCRERGWIWGVAGCCDRERNRVMCT